MWSHQKLLNRIETSALHNTPLWLQEVHWIGGKGVEARTPGRGECKRSDERWRWGYQRDGENWVGQRIWGGRICGIRGLSRWKDIHDESQVSDFITRENCQRDFNCPMFPQDSHSKWMLDGQRQHMSTSKVRNKTHVFFLCSFLSPFMIWSRPAYVVMVLCIWGWFSQRSFLPAHMYWLAFLPKHSLCPFHHEWDGSLCLPTHIYKYMAYPTLWISLFWAFLALAVEAPTVRPCHR